MAELYDVLDANEIDGQGKDADILAVEADTAWSKVMIHPAQEVPAGDYVLALSMQVTFSANNNSILWRAAGAVALDEEELHLDKTRLLIRHTYFFNLSWDGGLFAFDMEMARANTSFTAVADYAEFTLTRRS